MRFAAALFALLSVACVAPSLPVAGPPLVDLEEPPAFLVEPEDEAQRRALPRASFSGLELRDARRTLDALLGPPEGLEVVRVVENSPAAAAGLETGDVLLAVLAPASAAADELAFPSQWAEIEAALPPGTRVELAVDRAGRERRAALVLAERVGPPQRLLGERLREEERVGLVVRSATEVEAAAAELPPGAGAVVVGLARSSPWRGRGIAYGDLVRAVDGRRVDAPVVLLDALRQAPSSGAVRVEVQRGEERFELDLPLSRRERETRRVWVPLIANYERDGPRRSLSLVLGLVRHERTPAAWRLRLLYLIRIERGDGDRLVEREG